jgi:hypothetical protein
MNLNTVVLCSIAPGNQLFVEGIGPVHQSFSLLIKDADSGVLSKAFLLPFAERTVILVDRSLLSLSQFLVFTYLML